MERVAIAGLSLHHADLAGVERIKHSLGAADEPVPKFLADRLGASEVVCLSTCNRFEVIYARENGHAPSRQDLDPLAEAFGLAPGDILRGALFHHAGSRAARHLFRVAASLDSLVLGEDQILAQVRSAFAEARSLGLTGHLLGPLFEQAVLVGKRVRTGTELTRHPVSVVSLAVAFLAERLAAVPGARIAVIGAGATGSHAARALVAAGLAPSLVANRSPARAASLAEECGARPITLEALRSGAERLDALVSATGAPGHVLDAAALGRLAAHVPSGRRLYAVDLALPRDLEPGDDERIERIDLEALRKLADENRARRAAAAAEAEQIIEERLALVTRERAVERVSGSYAEVVDAARETFELELARLGQGRLAHLLPEDRRSVERWARSAFGRLAHLPFRALKDLARKDRLPLGEWEGLE